MQNLPAFYQAEIEYRRESLRGTSRPLWTRKATRRRR